MINSLVFVFYDLLILCGLFLLGALVVWAILGKTDLFALLSVSFGIGAGMLSWSMFIASWAGLGLSVRTTLGLYAVLTVAAALLARRTARSNPIEEMPPDPARGRLDLWLTKGFWILIVILIIAAAFLAVGMSYFAWDDISNWAVKGYGIAFQGSILAGREWGDNGLSYPMNIPLLIALFRLLDGNILPGSKLLYPVFYASLLIGCYWFWVVHGLKRWIAALGVLLLASTPILFTHAYMGYANLPFAYYLTMGLFWCIEGVREGGTRKTLLGGFLLAIAVWTRPEGFVMCAAIVLALGTARMISARGKIKLLPLFLPIVILGGLWYIFLRMHSTLNAQAYQYSGLAVKGLLAGNIKWSALYTVLRFIAGQVVRFRDWGFILLLLIVLLVIGLRPRDLRRDLTRSALFFATVALSLTVVGADFMSAYSPEGSGFTYTWISMTFTRVFMPAGVCMTVLGFLAIKDLLNLNA
jgi:hypothetical protein